jgi:hypothetical protein
MMVPVLLKVEKRKMLLFATQTEGDKLAPPHGARGSKRVKVQRALTVALSRPARGARIEVLARSREDLSLGNTGKEQ